MHSVASSAPTFQIVRASSFSVRDRARDWEAFCFSRPRQVSKPPTVVQVVKPVFVPLQVVKPSSAPSLKAAKPCTAPSFQIVRTAPAPSLGAVTASSAALSQGVMPATMPLCHHKGVMLLFTSTLNVFRPFGHKANVGVYIQFCISNKCKYTASREVPGALQR